MNYENKVIDLVRKHEMLFSQDERLKAIKISTASEVAHDYILSFLDKKISERLQVLVDKQTF